MQYFKSLAFVALAGVAFQVAAEDVPYVKMSICDKGPFKSLRDYWDQTKTFCFVRDNQEIKYPISDMGEIKLRENGQSLFGEYYNALSSENRAVVNQYHTYYVRYLALSDGKLGQAQSFVTQVFYNWGGSTQTIYAFGEITAGGDVRLTGFSTTGDGERHYRSAYNTLKSVFSVFNGRDPVKVGAEKAKHQDQRRIEPAADVVKHYQGKDKPVAIPGVPKL